jgi:hypothetical protein
MGRELFKPMHPANTLENNLPPESFKGFVNPEEAAKVSFQPRISKEDPTAEI